MQGSNTCTVNVLLHLYIMNILAVRRSRLGMTPRLYEDYAVWIVGRQAQDLAIEHIMFIKQTHLSHWWNVNRTYDERRAAEKMDWKMQPDAELDKAKSIHSINVLDNDVKFEWSGALWVNAFRNSSRLHYFACSVHNMQHSGGIR